MQSEMEMDNYQNSTDALRNQRVQGIYENINQSEAASNSVDNDMQENLQPIEEQNLEMQEVVPFDDNQRRLNQIQQQGPRQPLVNGEITPKQRKIMIGCYVLGASAMLICPYDSCDSTSTPSIYKVNVKIWLTVYFLISSLQLTKYFINNKVQSLVDRNILFFHWQARIQIGMTVLFELIHASWQILGNLIYFEDRGIIQANPDSQEAFLMCFDQNNPGFRLSMFILLLVGYAFFLFYFVIILIMSIVGFNRYKHNKNKISMSERCLKHIKREQYTEDRFGKISESNECIICMTAYEHTDMMTELNCTGKHHFHTNCIENWIQKGGHECPVCRTHILNMVYHNNLIYGE